MTNIYLVRHAPTGADAMIGWSDVPADLGNRDTLARLDAHLPRDAVVISSDLSRASATADAIAGSRHRLSNSSDLREIHFGAWETLSWSDINAKEPCRLREFLEYPGNARPPGGESWNQLRSRCDRTIDRMIAMHRGRALIAVCHFGPILTQIQRALNCPARDVFGFRIDNLSITEIMASPAGWRLERHNHHP